MSASTRERFAVIDAKLGKRIQQCNRAVRKYEARGDHEDALDAYCSLFRMSRLRYLLFKAAPFIIAWRDNPGSPHWTVACEDDAPETRGSFLDAGDDLCSRIEPPERAYPFDFQNSGSGGAQHA